VKRVSYDKEKQYFLLYGMSRKSGAVASPVFWNVALPCEVLHVFIATSYCEQNACEPQGADSKNLLTFRSVCVYILMSISSWYMVICNIEFKMQIKITKDLPNKTHHNNVPV
jgi:hypothetical protein